MTHADLTELCTGHRDDMVVDAARRDCVGNFGFDLMGGDDGRPLFLCTAPSLAEHERRDTREAALLAVRVEVPAA